MKPCTNRFKNIKTECKVIVTDKNVTVKNGILSDVAPTLLHYLEIPQPKEMTGKCLVKEK